MKVPRATPPFTRDEHSRAYRFPYAGVQGWLAERAVQRKALRKPYLRWLTGVDQPAAASVQTAERPPPETGAFCVNTPDGEWQFTNKEREQ